MAINRVAAERLEVRQKDVLGTCLWDILPTDVGMVRKNAVHQVLQEKSLLTTRDQRGDRHFSIQYQPVLDEADEVAALAIFATDVTEQATTEATLKAEEASYRTLAQNSPDVITRFDRNGRHLYVNPAVRHVLNLDPQSLLGKTHQEAGYPEKFGRCSEKLIRNVLDSGACMREQLEFDIQSGNIILDCFLSPECDEQGVVQSVLRVCRDITELSRVRREQHCSETKFRKIFEHAGDAMFLHQRDKDGLRLLEVNAAASALFGYSRAELFDLPVAELFAPTVREIVPALIKRTLDQGSLLFESVGLREDGERIPAECHTHVFVMDGQQVFLTVVRDISARKEQQKQLVRSEQFHRSLFENTGAATFISDDDCVIRSCNAEFERLSGYDRDEIEGVMQWTDFVDRQDLEQMREYHERRFDRDNPPPWDYECTCTDREGRRKRVQVKVGVVPGTRTRVTSFLDISQRVAAENDLKQTLEATNDGIWDFNLASGKFRYSDRWAEMLGYAQGELSSFGCFCDQNVHPEDMPRFRKAFDDYIAGRSESYEIEFRLRIKTGGYKWIYSRGRIVERDASGKPMRIIGAHTDIDESRQMLLDMHLLRDRLQGMFEHLSIGVAVYEAVDDGNDFIFVDFNKAAEHITGAARETVQGQKLGHCFPDLATNGLSAALRKVWKSGEPEYMEPFYVQKDRSGWRENRIYRIPSGEVVALFEDVTDRVRSEQALRESESRLKDLFENSPVGIFQTDSSGKVLHVNPEMARIVGASSSSEAVRCYPDLSKGLYVDSNRRTEFLDLLQQKGQVTGFEYEAKRLDGQRIWISMNARVRKKRQDGSFLIDGFALDVTERKQAEQAMVDSESSKRAILNAIPDLIFQIDSEGIFTGFQGSRDLLFAGPETFLGKTLEEVLPGFLARKTRQGIQAVLAGQELYEYEYPLTVNGRERSFEARMVLLDTATVLSLVRDVTAHKEAEAERTLLEKQLRQAQKMEAVGTLAGGIAHDFNNILAAIVNLSVLARRQTEDEMLLQDLDQVSTAALRGRDLVKQILFFSRKSSEEQVPVQMESQIKEIVKFLRSSTPKTIDITQDLRDAGTVLISPTHLHQIVVNICSNAMEAMLTDKGKVSIRLAPYGHVVEDVPRPQVGLQQDCMVLSIQDSGPGIDPALEHRIFDPFFTTKSSGQGTGLGLAVVHGLVKEAGGDILLENHPGKGCAFHVFLPRHTGHFEVHQTEERIVSNGKGRILFVDDEEAITDSSVRILQMHGFEATGETDPKRGLELFAAGPRDFDLVVVDMTMPGMSGKEFIRQIREFRRDLPVVLSSGYSVNLDRGESEELGIAGILNKPVKPARLISEIQRLIHETKQGPGETEQ